jgi:hypothetical protein
LGEPCKGRCWSITWSFWYSLYYCVYSRFGMCGSKKKYGDLSSGSLRGSTVD